MTAARLGYRWSVQRLGRVGRERNAPRARRTATGPATRAATPWSQPPRRWLAIQPGPCGQRGSGLEHIPGVLRPPATRRHAHTSGPCRDLLTTLRTRLVPVLTNWAQFRIGPSSGRVGERFCGLIPPIPSPLNFLLSRPRVAPILEII